MESGVWSRESGVGGVESWCGIGGVESGVCSQGHRVWTVESGVFGCDSDQGYFDVKLKETCVFVLC